MQRESPEENMVKAENKQKAKIKADQAAHTVGDIVDKQDNGSRCI